MIQQIQRPYTAKDLESMPDDGRRYEIIGGELVVSPSPTTKHQWVSTALLQMLGQAANRSGGFSLPAPLDVHLGAHDVVQPDVVYVGPENLHVIQQRGIVGAPDLVIEVISSSSRGRDRVRKSALYAGSGVREYWIVDPLDETILAQELKDGVFVPLTTGPDDRARSKVLDGFEVIPADLFEIPEALKDRI